MSTSYCAGIVRSHDYDRYLCVLFAPLHIREAWFALFAFNHEIAVIPEIVSEDMVGFVRFAWWRDALDKMYAEEEVPHHPVAEALAKIIHEYRLPKARFDALIHARAHHLEVKEFVTREALQAYCHDTSTSLLHVCAIIANLPLLPLLDDLGMAWAYIGLLRRQSQLDDADSRDLLDSAEQYMQRVRAQYREQLRIFAPFVHVCDFYLRRLQARKINESLPLLHTKLIANLVLRSLL